METIRSTISDGVQSLYDADFGLGFLKKEHVYVYTGTNNTLYETQIDYEWIGETQVQLLNPDQYPVGTLVNVRRVTPRHELYAEFKYSVGLTENALNKGNLQALMILEEIDDGFGTVDLNLILGEDILDAFDFGELAYLDMVEEAKLGTTIMEGGYIKTELIDVNNLVVNNSLRVGGVLADELVQSSDIGLLATLDKVGWDTLDTTIIQGGYILASRIDVGSMIVHDTLYVGGTESAVVLGNIAQAEETATAAQIAADQARAIADALAVASAAGDLATSQEILDAAQVTADAATATALAAEEALAAAQLAGTQVAGAVTNAQAALDAAELAETNAAAALAAATDAASLADSKLTAAEVYLAISTDTTAIDGARITTGTVNAARLNLVYTDVNTGGPPSDADATSTTNVNTALTNSTLAFSSTGKLTFGGPGSTIYGTSTSLSVRASDCWLTQNSAAGASLYGKHGVSVSTYDGTCDIYSSRNHVNISAPLTGKNVTLKSGTGSTDFTGVIDFYNGGTRVMYVKGNGLYPGGNNVQYLGWSTSLWQAAYATAFYDAGGGYNDTMNDLAVISEFKPKMEKLEPMSMDEPVAMIDPKNDSNYLDIHSIPEWLTNKDQVRQQLKAENGDMLSDTDIEEMLLDDDEAGWLVCRDTMAFADLHFGAIRQLDTDVLAMFNLLATRISALEQQLKEKSEI